MNKIHFEVTMHGGEYMVSARHAIEVTKDLQDRLESRIKLLASLQFAYNTLMSAMIGLASHGDESVRDVATKAVETARNTKLPRVEIGPRIETNNQGD